MKTTTIYLLHFEPAYRHAKHYLGSTSRDAVDRTIEHLIGRASPLVAAAVNAGCVVQLVRTWSGGRDAERRLHRRKDSPRICPACSGDRALGRAKVVA